MSKPKLTLEAFAEWCEAKDPTEEYNYFDTCGCAVAQYSKMLGLPYQVCLADDRGDFWQQAEYMASYSVGASETATFATLAKTTRNHIAARAS